MIECEAPRPNDRSGRGGRIARPSSPRGRESARAIAERAQTFRDAQDYMDSWPWFPVERADRPDLEVRW